MHKVFGHDPEVDRIVSEFYEEEYEVDEEEDPTALESYFFDPDEDDY